MSCPICFNKPMNCDCSEEARQLYYLRQEMQEKEVQQKVDEEQKHFYYQQQSERKSLFEKVAVQLIPCLVPNEKEWIKNKDLIQKARGLTEAILSAAEQFAVKQSDGERMEKKAEFDLDEESKNYAYKTIMPVEGLVPKLDSRYAARYGFLAGFNKALDLVMEAIDANTLLNRIIVVDADELKAIISKLRGEK